MTVVISETGLVIDGGDCVTDEGMSAEMLMFTALQRLSVKEIVSNGVLVDHFYEWGNLTLKICTAACFLHHRKQGTNEIVVMTDALDVRNLTSRGLDTR